MTNYSTMVFLASDDVIAVGCVFNANEATNDWDRYKNGPEPVIYTYKCLDKTIKVGDLVIVEVGNINKNPLGFAIAKVASVDIEIPLKTEHDYKWVVSKIDLTEHERNLAIENSIISEIKKLELANGRKQLAQALGLNSSLEFLRLPRFKSIDPDLDESIDLPF